MILNDFEKLAAVKMIAYLLNKKKSSSLHLSTSAFNGHCTVSCNYKTPTSSNSLSFQNSTNIENKLSKYIIFGDVIGHILATELENLEKFCLRKINGILLSSDKIWIHREACSVINETLHYLVEYASSSYIIQPWSHEQCNLYNFCFLLIENLKNKQILSDILSHCAEQGEVPRDAKDFTKIHRTEKISKKLQTNITANYKPPENAVLKNYLSLEFKSLDACIETSNKVLQQLTFNNLKRRHYQYKIACRIEASTSYQMKFNDIVGIIFTAAVPKRFLVTPSGVLTSDIVVSGKREKHFSQAFLNYISPEYSEQYTSSCSKSVSIAGALNAIKSYLRRRKDEYNSKKLANEKKRKALQMAHTSYTYTNSYDPFDRVGYGCYCY